MNPQLSALSVEREDIIKEHAHMLWHDPSLHIVIVFCCSSLFPSFFLELCLIVSCICIWKFGLSYWCNAQLVWRVLLFV